MSRFPVRGNLPRNPGTSIALETLKFSRFQLEFNLDTFLEILRIQQEGRLNVSRKFSECSSQREKFLHDEMYNCIKDEKKKKRKNS